MNFLNKVLQFSFIAIFTITISAEYKLGRDYKLVSNPLPVKKDGIVEVTESFWYGCYGCCLLYTSPSPRDRTRSRMPSSA